jgi:hypothetical protein
MRYELAKRLQEQFSKQCPAGWRCFREHPVLESEFIQLLGYRPIADVMVENVTSGQRIWIEIEISRADPVANHAKFGSAHLLQPFPLQDTFVSLVSRHIAPGRANLAAHAIYMPRGIGLRAYQMPLFPELTGTEIKNLNHAKDSDDLPPKIELRRLIQMTRGAGKFEGVEISFATNSFEVQLNLAQWNRDVSLSDRRQIWRCRPVKYFVTDSAFRTFAPCKFCAYTVMQTSGGRGSIRPSMEIPLYTRIDYNNSIFDGNRAWRNLVALGYRKERLQDQSDSVRKCFSQWLKSVADLVHTNVDQCNLLIPR